MTDHSTCPTLDALLAEPDLADLDAALADHTARCARCAEDEALFASLDDLLPTLRAETCPPEVLAAARTAARYRPADRPAVAVLSRRPAFRRAVAALASVCVVAAAAWMWARPAPSPAPQPIAEVTPIPADSTQIPGSATPPEPTTETPRTVPARAPQPLIAAAPEAPARRTGGARPRRAAPLVTPAPSPAPEPVASDSVAEATEQVYLALAIAGRSQALASATLAEEARRVEQVVRSATPF